AALAKAMLARRTCPACHRDAGYCIPSSLGMCVTCADSSC
ncbi:RRQRL motif-containing zinc-binding protein, partial [Streptomyces sp. NPDC001515]